MEIQLGCMVESFLHGTMLVYLHKDNGAVPEFVPAARLGNSSTAAIDLTPATVAPVSAAIYQLDGLVRRAPSLQLTADAKAPAQEAWA